MRSGVSVICLDGICHVSRELPTIAAKASAIAFVFAEDIYVVLRYRILPVLAEKRQNISKSVCTIYIPQRFQR